MIGGFGVDFYPRSPCGERQHLDLLGWLRVLISIHALLAESDGGAPSSCFVKIIFLSTLSLRRATLSLVILMALILLFLSTLSLRRATDFYVIRAQCTYISIHALLAESDGGSGVGSWPLVIFLSTLSLRRATLWWFDCFRQLLPISIHALLAESDQLTA